ncbi:hypothetical protein NL676_032811 [Syzygium grande]|nr:hypothetical protein NL676_032811 [Syzygium grande]
MMDLLLPSGPYQSLPRTPIVSQPEPSLVPSTDAPPDSGLPRPTPLQVYRRGPCPIWDCASPQANVPPPSPAPASDPLPPTLADSPIARCTRSRYPLFHYVSYHNLTRHMSLFVSSLASVSVPSSVQEALPHQEADTNFLQESSNHIKSAIISVNKTKSVLVSELQSQLESTEASIQAKKRDELQATKAVNELPQALDRTRDGMDALKQEINEWRQVIEKLKQVLRVKRQRIQDRARAREGDWRESRERH